MCGHGDQNVKCTYSDSAISFPEIYPKQVIVSEQRYMCKDIHHRWFIIETMAYTQKQSQFSLAMTVQVSYGESAHRYTLTVTAQRSTPTHPHRHLGWPTVPVCPGQSPVQSGSRKTPQSQVNRGGWLSQNYRKTADGVLPTSQQELSWDGGISSQLDFLW